MSKRENVEADVIQVKLCGVQGCCPTVTVKRSEKKIVITDDFGGSVCLTQEEWEDAKKKVKF